MLPKEPKAEEPKPEAHEDDDSSEESSASEELDLGGYESIDALYAAASAILDEHIAQDRELPAEAAAIFRALRDEVAAGT